MSLATIKLSAILWGLSQLLSFTARRHRAFKARLKERNMVLQIIARDEEVGRWYRFHDGNVTSGSGRHESPDVTLAFKNAAIGARLLTPPIDWLRQINAQKDFKIGIDGPEDLSNWAAQTIMLSQSAGL